MIFAVLKGGLGNQLFILAAALEQARRLEVDLGLICQFNPETPHAVYGFNELKLPKGVFLQGALKNSRKIYFPKASRRHYTESDFSYQREIEKIKDGTTLSGYFQSWRYFYNVRYEIWNMLETHRMTSIDTQISAEDILPKISIHLRRGDYTERKNLDLYTQLDRSYYQRAITQASLDLDNQFKSPIIKCFSDSRGEAQKMFQSESISIAEETNPLRSLLDMSDCDALVSANSSFSWWGGWLASQRGAFVYCPSQWFQSRKINYEDLYLKDWNRLSVG